MQILLGLFSTLFGILALLALWMASRGSAAIAASEAATPMDWTIIVPCFCEGDALTAALDRFHLAKLGPAARLVVLLSAPTDRTLSAHRAGLSWKAAHDDARVQLLVTPAACTSKALKLVHYFRSVSNFSTASNRLFLVVDVDARYTLRPPRALQHASGADDCAFQAVPFVVAHDIPGMLVSALALAHAERSAMEAWALHRWHDRQRPFLLGFMGAGMAFSATAIRKLMPWDATSDDIRMGYRADLLGIPRGLLPWLARVQPAPNFQSWFRQQVRVAAGVFSRRAETAHCGFPAQRSRVVLSLLFDWLPGFRWIALTGVGVTAAASGVPLAWGVALLALGIHALIPLHAYWRLGRVYGDALPAGGPGVVTALLAAIVWVPLRAIAACTALAMSVRKLANLHAVSTGG